jgi:fumarate hydratase subunit alpha
MRQIEYDIIVKAVKSLCERSAHRLPADVVSAIQQACDKEADTRAKNLLQQLLDNARIAADELYPLCQDTGVAVVFVEQGRDVFVSAPADRPQASLIDAINEGVQQGYENGYLRKSIVDDPVKERKNTGTNTPAVVHLNIVDGDRLKIAVMLKGGGCENRSQVRMLKPADGEEGVKDFVVEVVRQAGADACPPFVVGVGIGGNFEMSCVLAKKALLRPLDSTHENSYYAAMERELLTRINALGIGPQGMGGRTTALGVLIETLPCHIASLPVAVNIECHSHRHESVVI